MCERTLNVRMRWPQAARRRASFRYARAFGYLGGAGLDAAFEKGGTFRLENRVVADDGRAGHHGNTMGLARSHRVDNDLPCRGKGGHETAEQAHHDTECQRPQRHARAEAKVEGDLSERLRVQR